ncbi:hypothetical protein [Vibrio algarum]|uniref:Uncharacterized protein n=1 Tax=Vibrio algarum TaxID=3020714 RepID=A0ABT4YN02_9VIBR|nr:hypothetical protein [Vibrio sp. KJ40-1]MDB1122830.1 hypothetical protein [Vibrio sp. KJ40-1]
MENKTEVILQEAQEAATLFKPPWGMNHIKPLLINVVWLLKSFNARLAALEKGARNDR